MVPVRRIGAASIGEHEDGGGEGEGEGDEAENEDEGVETAQFVFRHRGVEARVVRRWTTVITAVAKRLRGSHAWITKVGSLFRCLDFHVGYYGEGVTGESESLMNRERGMCAVCSVSVGFSF